MKRQPLIAGNWKMHLNIAQAKELAEQTKHSARQAAGCEVMIAPPFTMLPAVAEVLHDSDVILAGQNVCWAAQGAFTGEISPAMLKEHGCRMAIVGHSERRHVFGEDNRMVNKRLLGAMEHGLTPVLCIGEELQAREDNKTFDVLEDQVRAGLQDTALTNPAKLVVAYEPVWAIGTGKTASVEQAQEAHVFIRAMLADIFDKTIASQVRILYGGSVKSDNIDALMAQEDIDGALVGGAALDAASFDRIINFI